MNGNKVKNLTKTGFKALVNAFIENGFYELQLETTGTTGETVPTVFIHKDNKYKGFFFTGETPVSTLIKYTRIKTV